MITSLRLVDFKNFADETLRAGPFTVIVGANASGKSNIRDAFRFLHGIGRGYTLAEIIGGKYGAGGQVEWAPIRGAASEIIRFEQSGFSLRVELKLGKTLRGKLKLGKTRIRYSIEVEYDEDSRSGFRVMGEALVFGQDAFIRAVRMNPILFMLKTTMHTFFFAWRRPENKESTAIGSQSGRISRP